MLHIPHMASLSFYMPMTHPNPNFTSTPSPQTLYHQPTSQNDISILMTWNYLKPNHAKTTQNHH